MASAPAGLFVGPPPDDPWSTVLTVSAVAFGLFGSWCSGVLLWLA